MTNTSTNPPDTSEPDAAAQAAFGEAFGAVVDDPPDPVVTFRMDMWDCYFDADWPSLEALYLEQDTDPVMRAELREMMMTNTGGLDSMAANPALAARYVAGASVEELQASGFLTSDAATPDVKVAILVELAGRRPGDPDDPDLDRDKLRDPAVFHYIMDHVSLDLWNDTARGLGQPKRGLGPRVCSKLWNTGSYDVLCDLIRAGVDTTTAAQADTRGGAGVYSGFVMPLQHAIQKYLPDIAKLGTDEAEAWDEAKRAEVAGARQIFAALEEANAAVSVTSWEDVQNSELIAAFEAEPGTIWGFENMRLPYVQAAHQTEEGVRPVRMMELWDAVAPALSTAKYEKLIANPDVEIRKILDRAADKVGSDIDKEIRNPEPGSKYHDVARDKDTYLKNFCTDAEAFLREFAAQIPEGTFIRQSRDAEGQSYPGSWGELSVADVAGEHFDKLMSGFACRAGLWQAKADGKPVYYCIDGINMDDVINYKAVKNRQIEEFLAAGGATETDTSHKEVITMAEVREILGNWDDLKGTVKFVYKGRLIDPDADDSPIEQWRQDMIAADQQAGRAPAPPRARFEAELNALLPGLYQILEDTAQHVDSDEVDKDARDLVRQAGYLVKFANVRPEYVIKYLMSKCEILVQYGLLPRGIVPAAAHMGQLAAQDPPATKPEIKAAALQLTSQIKACAEQFRKPLAQALRDAPMLKHQKKTLKKMAK